VEAAAELFERKGYEGTTIADIAAAAEIGTRTFFSYFSGKEDVLFPDVHARVRAAAESIESRQPGETPAQALVRAMERLADAEHDLPAGFAALRLRLFREVPAVRGRALQLVCESMIEIAKHLAAAFPEELDEVSSVALSGAVTGAVLGALYVLVEKPDQSLEPAALCDAGHQAIQVALAPWLRT
jgi:AcrR family transcriptional regulator